MVKEAGGMLTKKANRSHTIGRAARLIFERAHPREWIFRPTNQDDYGVDGTIEIVEGENVTGQHLFIQLKGSERLSYTPDAVKIKLAVKDVKYLDQHQLPAILVVVDVKREKTYWLEIQNYVRARTAKEGTDWLTKKSATISVPIKQDESTLAQWRRLAHERPRTISLSKHGLPSWEDLEAISKIDGKETVDDPRQDAAIAALSSGASLNAAMRLIAVGKREEALPLLERAWHDALASTDEVRVLASAKAIVAILNPADQESGKLMLDIALRGAEAAKKLAHPGEHLYLQGLGLLPICYAASHHVYRYRVMLQSAGGDALTRTLLAARLDHHADKLSDLTFRLGGVIGACHETKRYIAMADLMRHLALFETDLYHKLVTLREGPTPIVSLRERAFTHAEIATIVAKAIGDQQFLAGIVQHEALIHHALGDPDKAKTLLAEAQQIAQTLGDAVVTRDVQTLAEKMQKPKALPARPTRDEIPEDEKDRLIEAYVREIAHEDPDAPDETSRLIKIGLKDRNPERALTWCEHLHFAPVVWGEPGHLLQLPTAGRKALHCEKKKGTISGLELDSVFVEFRDGPCVGCPHRAPRKNWKWSEKWQRERPVPAEFLDYIDQWQNLGRPRKGSDPRAAPSEGQ